MRFCSFWCLKNFGFPYILLRISFPVTDDLFFLGFADVCCYFVLLYPGLELRFCCSYSRFVFGSSWPLCWLSCVKSFHLCIWFLCILLWTEKLKKGVTFVWFWFGLVLYYFGLKTNVTFVWFSFCSLLFILPPLWFCVSVRFDWCLKSFYLCIWFLFYSLYFSASFFSGYSLPFFWGFANVCCYFVLLSRFLFFCIFLFRLLFTFFFFGFANVCCYFVLLSRFWTALLLFFFDYFHWPSLYLVPFDSLPICLFL